MKKWITFSLATMLALTACGQTTNNQVETTVTSVETTKETTTTETTTAETTTKKIETTTEKIETTTEESKTTIEAENIDRNYNNSITISGIKFSDLESYVSATDDYTYYYLTFFIENSSDSTQSIFMDNLYVRLSNGEYRNFKAMYDYDWVLKNLHHDLNLYDIRPGQKKHGALCLHNNPADGAELYYKDQLVYKF